MRRWFFFLIPVIGLSGMIAWRLKLESADALAQAKQREARGAMAPVVSVVAAARRDIVQTFEGVGTIEAPLDVKVASKITGRIEFMQVHEGDAVTAGQVLVRINPAEIEADLLRQQAALAEARSRYAQAEITENAASVGVGAQIHQQEASLSSARAALKLAEESSAAEESAAEAAVNDAGSKVEAAQAAILTAEAGVRSARANVDNARTRLSRVDGLYKQGFIAAQEVDDARTEVSVRNGALDVATSQLGSAKAARDSAASQKLGAEKQLDIVRSRGRADIAAAKSRVVQAAAGLEAARANIAQRPAYRASLSALRAAVATAEAAVRSAEARRADTVLTSPIDGVVTDRHMDLGTTAVAGQPILTLQAIRQVWVTVPVREEESRRLRLGLPATVRLDALPGRTFLGKVVQLNPAADPQSRQFNVRVGLDNSKGLLRPGMFARATLETLRRVGTLTVPREAIQQSPRGPFAMVVDERAIARKRIVTLGISDSNGFEILSGLAPGDRTIVLSVAPVRDGATVRVVGPRPAHAESGRP